jgi:alanine-glyoxylate transaminase/serine-glyoxylate transaminase/serine-pyruvate transaminase
MIAEEGMEARLQRHLRHGSALQTGLEAMGLKLHSQEGYRLSNLTLVCIPPEVDDLKVRKGILNDFGIEIGGGLGPLKGQVWRIGLMGHSSSAENVWLLLSALERQLLAQGYPVPAGVGVAAAIETLKK